MKKILFTLLFSILLIPCVKADDTITTIDLMQTEFTPYSNVSTYEGCVDCGLYLQDKYIYNDFDKFYSNQKYREIFNTLYEDLPISSDPTENAHVSVLILSNSSSKLDLFAIIITLKTGAGSALINQKQYASMYADGNFYYNYTTQSSVLSFEINNSTFHPKTAMIHSETANPFVVGVGDFSSTWFYLPTTSFMNDKKFYNQAENVTFNIYNTSNELINTVTYASELPSLYYWQEFNPSSLYTEVNLDNYEYVLLSLKDYSKTEAFETNLQVKGSIGITPIYEYGTVEKSVITDICNVSYSDFTDYRFFILENDLINNAIYAVKPCETGSSFKFDSTIFDITYVTADNVDDPVVTIGGQEYHTISFNKLSNTVNKNTEEGVIPGESEEFNPLKSIASYVTSFWNSLSSFMSLVTKFFNTLPVEIKAVAITCFSTACTLGLLKILKS